MRTGTRNFNEYNGTGNQGQLIDYSWKNGDIFSNPYIPSGNPTTDHSNLYVRVVTNSNVEFFVNDKYAPEDKQHNIYDTFIV